MHFSLRALVLAIFSLSFCALWVPASQAEYWSHPFIGKCWESGFACARKVSIAIYGSDQTFGRCYYGRDFYYGQIQTAHCRGSKGWGIVNLNCEAGEVKSTNGCIDKPIVDKDPPCEAQTGNPVDASSGMKLEYALDFTTAGPQPLKFERHYRSETNTKDGEYKTNRLGTGWRSNFDAAMYFYPTSTYPSSSLRFVLPNGTFYSFKTSNGVYLQRYYSWTKKEWVNLAINRSAKVAWNSSAQRYELTTPDDTVWSFDTSARLRSITVATGTPATLHYSYDRDGRLIAETDADSGTTLREYIWLEDLPVAVIDAAGLYHVVTDHLYRPVALFDSSGAEVWSAVWEPFGALHSVNGSVNLDARFPGQWYQLETGLHYNWHRHYDPTLGRYTQPDPIGLGGGANRFAYALANPIMNIDPDGQLAITIPFAIPVLEAIGGVAVGVLAGSAIASAINPPQDQEQPISYPVPDICIHALRPGSSKGKDWEKRKDECYEQCKHLMGVGHGNEYRGCFRRCMGTL